MVGPELETQLRHVAELGGGTYVQLSSSSNELIEEAIVLAENAIYESGLEIFGFVELIINGELVTYNISKWILIDNKPPSLVQYVVPVFVNDDEGISMKYKILCHVFDACWVKNVTCFTEIQLVCLNQQ